MNFRLILLFVVLPFMLSAQISITTDDMPSDGDTIRKSHTIEFTGLDYESSGPDFEWDFTELYPAYQTVDTFVSVSETPWLYQLVFMWSANLAQPLAEFDYFPDFSITDTYEFFKNSSSNYKSLGYGITMSGIPIPNMYDNADVIYNFPLDYDDLDSSTSSHGMGIPGMGYMGGWKKRVNHVDGWGTLTTPYGSFDVIRLKTEISQYDSLYVDSLGFGLPFERNYIEYKWIGNDFGIPLLTIVDEGLIPVVSYMDSVRTISFTGEKEIILNESLINIYPNPAVDKLNIRIENNSEKKIDVSIFDLSGKLIKLHTSIPTGSELITIDLNDQVFLPGIYLLNIKIGEELVVRKFVKD